MISDSSEELISTTSSVYIAIDVFASDRFTACPDQLQKLISNENKPKAILCTVFGDVPRGHKTARETRELHYSCKVAGEGWGYVKLIDRILYRAERLFLANQTCLINGAIAFSNCWQQPA
jgi:hypothetical protein